MLLNEFPDIHWIRKQAKTGFSDQKGINNIRLPSRGWPTVVLSTSINHSVERKDIVAPFSLFMNLEGTGKLKVANKSFSLTSDTFTIVNKGQEYDLSYTNGQCRTFNIHFGDELYKETLYGLKEHEIHLLDNPQVEDGIESHLFPVPEWRDQEVNGFIQSLNNHYIQKPKGLMVVDDQEYSILSELLALILSRTADFSGKVRDFRVQRSTTRYELLKRLNQSREYIHSNLDRPVTLDELSRVSCLSKYHFLRSFRELFGCTPHQYLTKLRISRAEMLLKKTDRLISQITRDLGYEEPNSFIRLFTQMKGVPPGNYRSISRN